jgi:pimeloyl-ACP methyl ester carboxylesterase
MSPAPPVAPPRDHIVDHSYGALVALQVAMDLPERVGSLALLEPAARGVRSSAAVAAALQPVVVANRSGDTAGAIDRFLRHVCGDGCRNTLQRVIPGGFDEASAEADLFFRAEMPAVQEWALGAGDARHAHFGAGPCGRTWPESGSTGRPLPRRMATPSVACCETVHQV